MSKRDEIIGSIPANFKSEELLFNLKLIYAKLMVGGVPRENYITYSQLKLTFDRARQIAEDPKWGIPEEVKKIDEEIGNLEDNAESRYKVFMGYMRAALTAVAYNVQLATKDPWNDSEIAEALTNRTAGILPSRFKDLEPGETRSLKPKVSDTDYTKELLLEAERLWMERVCFDFGAGDMQKKLDNAARYQTQDDFYKAKDSNSWDDQNIKDNFLVLNGLLIYELSGPQKENFYRYLRAIFQGTSAGSLRESKVDVSTGEITQSTSQLTAAQETITFAELMIAIALERPNIIILKFKDVPTPGKRVKGGMHATIGNYTFIIFNEVILNNPQGIDLAPGSRVPHRMSFRDTLIHECVHVYPIYENEYRGRENIPGLDINLSPEDVVKSLRTSGSRSTTLGSTEFPTGKTTDEQRQWMQDAFKARIDALLENPGSNLENIWGMRDLAAFDAEGVFSGAVQTAFAARLAAELTLEFYGDRPDVNPIEQYDPDVKTFLFLQTLATPEYDPQGDFEKGVKSLIETE
ncbi:hypothetical protein JXM67_11295, partial [candidate division WOR-3 bacterium]|nr:hypothetical protein [candidate division WOR-3 bacterium]